MRKFVGTVTAILSFAAAWFFTFGAIDVPEKGTRMAFAIIAGCFYGLSAVCIYLAYRRRPEPEASAPSIMEDASDPGPIHAPTRSAYQGGGTILVDNIAAAVAIRYLNRDGVVTDRTVQVHRIRGNYAGGAYEPETFFGFCQLREADRFFSFHRVQSAADAQTGEVITDLERHLARLGDQKVAKIEFSKLTPEEEAEVARVEEWFRVHGNHGLRQPLPPPSVIVVATDPSGTIAEFSLFIEAIGQYGGRPYILEGRGRRLERGQRRKMMQFTLPDFHTPGWEITALTPDGEKEPVADIPAWLSQQGRRGKR
jgi:hypothetical protein